MNAFSLKIIALISMLIDHIGYFLFPQMIILRIIGRIAFVIFAYFTANAYVYTKDKLKHGLTLLIYGILIDLVMLITGNYLFSNIFITLALGYFLIMAVDKRNILLGIASMIPLFILRIDYQFYGVLLILASYLLKDKRVLLIAVNIVLIYAFHFIDNLSLLQEYSTMGMIFLLFYNYQRGPKLKLFFYLFYPVHILILILIQHIL